MALTAKNKITTSLFLGLTLTFVGLNISSAMAEERAGGRSGGFSNADTNQDGALDLDEMIAAATAKVERKFSDKDTDEDGFVTFEEFTASGRGALDLTEYAEDIVQCVADLKEELGSETIQVPSVDDFKSPQEKFNALDTNSDGVVELTEATDAAAAKATEKFETLDADDDGLVTQEEKKAHAEAHKGTRRAIKTCIKEVTEGDDDSVI